MACIRDKKCAECGETKPVDVHSFNGVCCECIEKKATKARRMFLASLKGLTVEERLENIEATLYDLNISLPQTYQPKEIKYA